MLFSLQVAAKDSRPRIRRLLGGAYSFFYATRSVRAATLLALTLCAPCGWAKGPATEKAPTFNRDVAPIVFENCVVCHHPGGAGPFSLATYGDARKRAKLIAQVTASRYMPPWLPEHGHGDFADERRLTEEQITTLGKWMRAGAPEGAAADLKARAHWNDDWQLGKPDLVVSMPEGYVLPADGKDVYRNFVLPNAIPADVHLRALQVRPGNAAIHHGSVFFDDTGSARRLEALYRQRALAASPGAKPEPGFPGMSPGDGARMPSAMFTAWQPGKRPSEAPPGLAAELHKGADIVLQMHMRPSGKPEKITPSIGLYFTDHPATRSSLLLALRSVTMDIPPGDANYVAESSYTLPVDVEALAVAPHMHYLGRESHGWADLPDGTQKELILIKHWDFNWQGDYRYAAPVPLPAGTTLHMRSVFDNSAKNVRNPNHPPKEVTYGIQSSDEMAELWLQIVPARESDMPALEQDYYKNWVLPDSLARAEVIARLEPKNVENRCGLASALAVLGRLPEALQQVNQALVDDPSYAPGYYLLSQILIKENKPADGKAALQKSVDLDPGNAKAQGDLGWVMLSFGEIMPALEHLEKAVDLDPNDPLAQRNLKTGLQVARERLIIQRSK